MGLYQIDSAKNSNLTAHLRLFLPLTRAAEEMWFLYIFVVCFKETTVKPGDFR